MGNGLLLLERLTALEVSLLDPAVRRSPSALEALLHPDFREVGRSGRFYNRTDVITALTAEPLPSDSIKVRDAQLLDLGDDCQGLLYLAVGLPVGVSTRRMSIWRKTEAGWQMIFHQGTPCP